MPSGTSMDFGICMHFEQSVVYFDKRKNKFRDNCCAKLVSEKICISFENYLSLFMDYKAGPQPLVRVSKF